MSKKIQVVGLDLPKSDWNQTDETKIDYIKNKPELGELAAKDKVSKDDLDQDVKDRLDTILSAVFTVTDDGVLNINTGYSQEILANFTNVSEVAL